VGFLAVALVIASALSSPAGVEDALKRAAQLEAAGDTEAAAQTYRAALDAAPHDSVARAVTLVRLSGLERNLGKYAASREHATEAAKIYEGAGERRGRAFALNAAGAAAADAGAYDDAAVAFESALTISTAIGDREGRAKAMTNLGSVFLYRGRYSDADSIFKEALSVTNAARTEEWAPRRLRVVLANRATLLSRLGKYQEALELYRQLGSGNVRAKTRVEQAEHAQVLVNMGVQYRRLGDPIKALAIYEEARDIFASNRHVDGELSVMKNRATVLALDLERFDDADRAFSEVLDLATRTGNRREMLVTLLRRGETRRRAGAFELARDDFEAARALARELQTLEEEWDALYGLGRVASQPDVARDYLRQAVDVIERIREGLQVPEMRNDFFKEKRDVYDALIARRPPHASAADTFALIERIHSRGWRDRLRLASAIDLVSVQHAVPDGALLLDYWSSSTESALVAVTRTRAAAFPVTVNDADVKAFIDGLAAGPKETWRQHSRSIAAQVLPPATWFNAIDHVIVVPDGALALIPFELLPVGDGLLIQHAAVSYTPTAATLLRDVRGPSSWSPPWRLELEAFADPVVDPPDSRKSTTAPRPLASSAQEVRDIASELGGTAVLHIGRENQKARLSAPVRAPILHLATHAMADASAIEQSRIMFSPAAASARADYLSLREAYELRLAQVDLAVLSACDTERGPTLRREGVESFSRAFMAAGARSTVTTLWRVADEPTAEFMKVFYHHLQRGVPKDEALRRAKLRFLDSGSTLSNPHFWAAFVLAGDGLRPVPRALSWRTILGFILLLMLIVAGAIAVIYTRRRNRGLMHV